MRILILGLLTYAALKLRSYFIYATKQDSIDEFEYYDDNQGLRPKYMRKGGK